ncbi:PucR family transcriptional regulator [Mycobacterium sp. 20091114027_K0903767]|nr:PucR family transcriptional regulator [Mycobacterium sp. 20091114027_K0903767]
MLQQLDNVDEDLAAEYLLQIDRGARFYDSVPEEDDLLGAARLAFRYLLSALLERPMSAELAEFPAAVGALRATQGIALENLTAAVRTDFLVAWSALLRLADDDDMAVLALHVDVLWQAVDDFASKVQRGYLDQRLSMARTSTLEQQHSLSELFSGEPAPTAVRRAAQILGLDDSATYWVIGTPGEEAGRTVTRRLLTRHLTSLDYIDHGVALILVAADGRWEDDEAVVADVLPGLEGAVAPRSVPLSEVHRAAATVRMLVDLDLKSTTLRRSWAQLSITQLSEVIDDLRGYVLGPLHALHDHELIVETIQVFAGSGSVSDTASELYCHRNTVMNRIRRFEEATGISLRSPRSLAMVQLCLLPT